MAKNDGTNGGGEATTAKPDGGDQAIRLSKDQVAKLLGAEVTIPVIGKDGKLVTVTEPGDSARRYKTETVRARAEHILSHRVAGDQITAVTIDGQKLTAPLR